MVLKIDTKDPVFDVLPIPKEIQDTHFFQECVSELPDLPGRSQDHVGVYRCEEKAGELIADRRWVQNHPRYAELQNYTQNILRIKLTEPEQAILFAKSALLLLDKGQSMMDACHLSRGLVFAVASSQGQAVREMVAEVEKPIKIVFLPGAFDSVEVKKEVQPVHLEALVLSASIKGPRSADVFKKDLYKFSREDLKLLQRNCVELWTRHLKKSGVSPVEAEREALKLLGSSGLDGKYGARTRVLLSNVLDTLSQEQKINLEEVHSAQQLNVLLNSLNLRDALSFISS